MIYTIYCWYWRKVDDSLSRKIKRLEKQVNLLKKRRCVEIDEFIRSRTLNESVLRDAKVKPWFSSCGLNRRRKRLERLRAHIERLEDEIEELDEIRGNRRLTVPRSFFLN